MISPAPSNGRWIASRIAKHPVCPLRLASIELPSGSIISPARTDSSQRELQRIAQNVEDVFYSCGYQCFFGRKMIRDNPSSGKGQSLP
jgi:hypothetical protein